MRPKYLKFWGTRGSCPVSGHEYLHFGGNTPCLELGYEGVRIIFDAGTGIRPLGKELVRENVHEINLFLSHMHWDHILGFPFFDPVYQKETKITIWAPQGKTRSCHDLFQEMLSPEFFPLRLSELQAKLDFRIIEGRTPARLGPIEIHFHRVNHPGLAYCFKIITPAETIGYVTDNELSDGKKEDSLVSFFRGCDLLIHEAQYFQEEYVKKKGWGHSCMIYAMEFVEQVKPKKWLITHHDPIHTDDDLKLAASMAEKSCSIPNEWLRDGQVVELK
jgi:phosphoribosyl 1,2-cyclic phosphodiesterase